MIGVDEERLRGEGLTPNETFYLLSIRDGKEDVILGKMSNVGFLKEFSYVTPEGKLTDKSNKYLNEVFKKITIKKTVTESDVKELSEKYVELFPKGVKSSNIPVKSNIRSVITKMIKFKSDYPKITDDTILAATAKYVEGKRKEGYAFMTCADYMILKNGVSLLATLCESYIEEKDGNREGEVKWGRNI